MIKIENVEVMGWEHAIRGMRNPKNSWANTDSTSCTDISDCDMRSARTETGCKFAGIPCTGAHVIGPNDHKLMMQLAAGGPVHAKYRRMIAAYLDITAPLYWWKEFDTYKVGTVANSCSTMHKIHDKEFTMDDFSIEHLVWGWGGEDKKGNYCIYPGPMDVFQNTIAVLNRVRESYLSAMANDAKYDPKTTLSAKDIWWQMIQLLPSSYNQKRTVMLNYEVLAGMYQSRKNHKLDEWVNFCKWIEGLPYSEIITGAKEEAACNG